MKTMVNIRAAQEKDFEVLYELGRSTPELHVSASQEFMDADEFRLAMTASSGVFLIAESDGIPAGFIYATTDDKDKPLQKHWACLVYLVVVPEKRGQGIASQLYVTCVEILKNRGTTHLYTWAHAGGSIVQFMERRGFAKGHEYVWMDKEL